MLLGDEGEQVEAAERLVVLHPVLQALIQYSLCAKSFKEKELYKVYDELTKIERRESWNNFLYVKLLQICLHKLYFKLPMPFFITINFLLIKDDGTPEDALTQINNALSLVDMKIKKGRDPVDYETCYAMV